MLLFQVARDGVVERYTPALVSMNNVSDSGYEIFVIIKVAVDFVFGGVRRWKGGGDDGIWVRKRPDGTMTVELSHLGENAAGE